MEDEAKVRQGNIHFCFYFQSLFMDITMKQKDGLEAARDILTKDPNERIIMVTALGQKKMLMDSIKLGVKDFFKISYILCPEDGNHAQELERPEKISLTLDYIISSNKEIQVKDQQIILQIPDRSLIDISFSTSTGNILLNVLSGYKEIILNMAKIHLN
jgi:chemotaxis response regulator CheB